MPVFTPGEHKIAQIILYFLLTLLINRVRLSFNRQHHIIFSKTASTRFRVLSYYLPAIMSRLLALPNETLLQINEVVQEDLENFTLSCKRIYIVGKDAIQKHRERKEKHTKVSCGRMTEDETWAVFHPILLLRVVLVNRNLALYPEHISLISFFPTFDENIMDEANQALEGVDDIIKLCTLGLAANAPHGAS